MSERGQGQSGRAEPLDRGEARGTAVAIAPSTLVRNVLLFGRVLRGAGIPMSAGREMELLAALQLIDLGDRRRVYEASKALLVSHRDHGPIFDKAFDLFFGQVWEALAREEGSTSRTTVAVSPEQMPDLPESELAGDPDTRAQMDPSRAQMAPESDEEQEASGDETPEAQTFSAIEVLRNKDFDRYSGEELARARELMRQLRLRPGTRLARRMVRSPSGEKLDMRAVVRGLQRSAGEPIKLFHRERKLKRRKLVLICDVSGSMERYSRVLLQFLHSVRVGMSDVEVFVFGTRLTRVTRDLSHRQIDAALDRIAKRVQDFAGGTRIGRSLHDFNRQWARRVMGQSAVCIMISDGWDRGDPRVLRDEMERLQRSSFRLIWLNPLLGMAEYQPVTLGMRTALEYVDDFMPAHNLASLEALARKLANLEGRRPVRRQSHL
jgi:uncharacterized protein with von Willebrand factor type A (vWA) domain